MSKNIIYHQLLFACTNKYNKTRQSNPFSKWEENSIPIETSVRASQPYGRKHEKNRDMKKCATLLPSLFARAAESNKNERLA